VPPLAGNVYNCADISQSNFTVLWLQFGDPEGFDSDHDGGRLRELTQPDLLDSPPTTAEERCRAEQCYYPVVTLQISLFPNFCGQLPRGHGAGKTRVLASCDC
jgi:hypothetical protein